MKRTVAIVLIMVLLASTVGALAESAAEVSSRKGYYVYDGTTPMYSVLQGKEWDVYAVIDYDREHFIRFSDPEKGFWGVGLKADSNPIGSEKAERQYTFENVAVILLQDACYDYETESYIDVQITLDKVTYASCAGAEVNEKTDVLGVFGYSRDMETVGFLSGWGCHAMRNAENEIEKTEDIWIVDDSAESDMPLVCEEVEFTVTPVRKTGSQSRRKR